MTGLLLGGLLVSGWQAMKKGDDQEARPPEGTDPEELYAWRRNRTIAGRETLLANAAEKRGEAALDAANPPPSPEAAESENTDLATKAANRTRRRARGGNSGRVTTGPGGTPGVGAGGSPRTLLGA